jgi:hypothetical protein
MEQWWQALTSLEKFFYYIAIPSTVVLAIQFILTLMGIGGNSDVDMDMESDMDFDFNADMDVSFDPSIEVDGYDPTVDFDADGAADELQVMGDFRFVTFRGIIAFFTIFGWSGQVVASKNIHIVLVMIVATVSGFAAMFVIALLFYSITKLQSSGNLSYKNAIGMIAEVYLTIPSKDKGTGKVQVLIQERLVEVTAISRSETSFKTGERVRVVDVFNGTTVVVESMDQ